MDKELKELLDILFGNILKLSEKGYKIPFRIEIERDLFILRLRVEDYEKSLYEFGMTYCIEDTEVKKSLTQLNNDLKPILDTK